jgi:glycosyltransferase involved in cell wall biosynthesis
VTDPANRNREITAVVACFNYGRFLEEAVESLLSQNGGPPNVIVVDDGSTDEATIAVLDSLPPELEVIRQPNQGVSAARNTGLMRANTPLVLALDADDRLARGALEAMRAGLDENPTAGFAYGHQRFFGAMNGVMKLPPYDPYKLLHRHLIGPTALTRQAVIADTGGYDTSFEYYEDWEFWMNALAHGWRGVRVDAITHEYRRRAGSKLARDRSRYRASRRQMKAKHAALFRQQRGLARAAGVPAREQLIYRAFWGPRPVPPMVEAWLYRRLWPSRPARSRTTER